MDILLVIAGGVLIGCFLTLSWFAGSDAPFVPSNLDNIKKLLRLAGVKKGKRFYDLGSGDGRIVIEAAKLKANAVGIEQSYLRILISRFKVSTQKIRKATFLHGNFLKSNFSSADVIYIYLLPKVLSRLEDKLKKELKKGSVVITKDYHFSHWRAFKRIEGFYLYKK
jgi:SAM-dependent methyltransferase